MDKNEVITLSSDEESDSTNRIEKYKTPKIIKLGLKNPTESLKSCLEKFKHINVNKNKGVIIGSNKQGVQIVKLSKVPQKKPQIIIKESPEVVDLEGSEKSVEDDQDQFHYADNDIKSPQNGENHSNLDIIDVDEISEENNPSNDTKINQPDVTKKNASKFNTVQETFQTETKEGILNECSQQNLKFFTEFVEYCGCLEEIPNDRARLTKKLMKRYGEADSSYVKSPEFRNIIQKCRDKVNKNNLYLIAKEITDELSYRKKIENNTGKSNLVEETCQRDGETVTEKVTEPSSKQSKKRTKVINKVIQKLDKLGCKIRELEEKEVDLSDEEESSYVQLQRYRERFCQIYTKLCKYTNEVADADRIYSRKICFTESKYPAINKCIENWLNKTKRFPDFSDIMKLLESQSASLGLPSNRESIRVIAIEIFQQVGAMLQRRRKYDLWDSFSGFLDEGEDPATNDVLLDQVLKNNYEIRVKKEQEIFQHFAELQEKERLEPEEVPDEEANHSPVESGSEDEKEIEEIENSLNKRLDDAIKKDTEENEIALGDGELDEGKNNSLETPTGDTLVKSKESKNNYRNCKSLKWRLESGLKRKSDSANSEDSNEAEKERQKKPENAVNGITDELETKCKSETPEKEAGSVEAVRCFDSPSKRKRDLDKEDRIPKKRKCDDNGEELDVLEMDEETDISGKKTGEVFQIHCCQIFADNVFEDLNEKRKDWGKRKVFRDLTNVSRLMELHGRKKKMSGLFSPSFFYRSFLEFEKPSWKKRFKVSFKLVGSKGQKCALNQEEKSGKTVNSDNRENAKNIQNNSEGARGDDGGDNFLGGRGNGSEGDNNEDENKKNGKTGDELNENQHEEDEDDEENEAEDNKEETEPTEHSFPNQKTEEDSSGNETLKAVKNWEEGETKGFETPETDLNSEKQNSGEIEETGKQNVKEIEDSEKQNKQNVEEIEDSEKQNKQNVEEIEEKEKEITGESSEPKKEEGTDEETLKNSEKEEEANLKAETNDVGSVSEECVVTETKSRKTRNRITKNKEIIEESREVRRKSQETKTNERANEDAEVTVESQSTDQNVTNVKCVNKRALSEEMRPPRNVRRRSSNKFETTTTFPAIENENVRARRRAREVTESKLTTFRKPIQVELPDQKLARRSAPSTSDEERVKRFLLHSPSSISITPPRKLTLSKPPSQAAMQALATLRNLKGISATIVRGSKPRNEDDVVVIGGSYNRRQTEQNSTPVKRRRASGIPVISNVQTVDATTPKIVTVQGNVSGFDNSWPDVSNDGNSQSSSIRISNVWGSLPNTFMQSGSNSEAVTPGCSFRQNNPPGSKKKNAKKTVEYVVLD